MGTFLVARRSEIGAASRGENLGALPSRSGFHGSHGGFDSAAGAGRVRFGVCSERGDGGDARSAGRPRTGAHAGNADGAAPRSAVPRESLRCNRRRQRFRGRDDGPGHFLAGSADFAETHAAAAVRTASDDGGAWVGRVAIDEATRVRGAYRYWRGKRT